MKPYKHQLEMATAVRTKISAYGLCYLAAQERTGKTLTSILVAEKIKKNNILIVTKKNALKGWNETLNAYKHKKNYTVTNYHQVSKLKNIYDFIILDESHNYITGYPKTSKIWKDLSKLTKNKPMLFISATPFAQGMQQIYNPLKLSSHSPFKNFKNFYEWFSLYGIESQIMTGRGLVKQYTKTHSDMILKEIQHLMVTMSRNEVGFEQEPIDKIHYVELQPKTKLLYNKLVKDKVAEFEANLIVLDSVLKERVSLHQIEGGTYKFENTYLDIKDDTKIDYIFNNFGDNANLVVMCHYVYELSKLQSRFKNARILSASKFSEGVDLSDVEHLVIYSQDFSTSKHIQRRARQCNINRTAPIIVHYILIKNGISEQVYNTVSLNKKNFTDQIYQEKLL